jgi:putative membrane protein
MINKELEQKLNIGAIIVSIAVLGLVLLMRRVKLDLGVDLSFLPPVHAFLNTLTAITLMYSFNAIKNGRVEQHRNANFFALGLSTVFLLCYVAYHFTTPETRFGGEGTIKVVYLILLLTHIVAAAVIFPFILFTFIRALTNQIDKHKKMARWVYWVWLYVALTGPICYLMLKPYYQ